MGSNKIEGSTFNEILAQNLYSGVSSLISLKPVAKFASGARTVLKINGNIIGFATNISWNIETTVSEIRTIDDYLPSELTPRHISVSGTLSGLMIPGMGSSKESIQSNVINFLQQKYITIEARDSQSDNLIFFTNKAMIISRTESLDSEQLGRITLSWRAIGWKDDLELSEYKVNSVSNIGSMINSLLPDTAV